jgi:DNA-directed RNA polymerase specialized sigma24 family protein
MTQESLEHLLNRLDNNREEAGIKYISLRRDLMNFFRLKGHLIPEEASDETLDRVAARLAMGEQVQDIRSYSYGVARYIQLEHRRKQARAQVALESYKHFQSANEAVDEGRFKLLAKCLEEISPQDRSLLTTYYEDLVSSERTRRRNELSAHLGYSSSQLRLRVHRLRRKVENCVQRLFRHQD